MHIYMYKKKRKKKEKSVEMDDGMTVREGGADMNWFLRYRRKSTADFRWECAPNLTTINTQIPFSQFPLLLFITHISYT